MSLLIPQFVQAIRRRAGAAVLAAAVSLAPGAAAVAQGPGGAAPTPEFMRAFDRVDRLSREILSTISCAQRAAFHRARGTFGPTDSIGTTGLCVRSGGRAIGVFMAIDTTWRLRAPLRAVDLGAGTRYTGAIDTAAAIAQSRVWGGAVYKGMAPYVEANRPFAPIALRFDGDSIEAWLLPTENLANPTPTTIGGERGFVFAPDGVTLVRQIDDFAKSRTLTVPAEGAVEIRSTETEVPTLGELLVANLLHLRGRAVSIITTRYRTNLVGTGQASGWVHLPNRP